MTPDAHAASPSTSSRILVLVAHPDLRRSRINRALLAAARTVHAAQPAQLRVHDLYAMYPDFGIDVQAEQAALAAAELVVWQHPLHWYGMPALMKLWLDEVLRQGWAYGSGTQALRGKQLWVVLSAGGTWASYSAGGSNGAPVDVYLAPYRQTAALCGLGWHEPGLLYGAAQVSEAELAAHVQAYAQRLRTWPQWRLPEHGTGAPAASGNAS